MELKTEIIKDKKNVPFKREQIKLPVLKEEIKLTSKQKLVIEYKKLCEDKGVPMMLDSKIRRTTKAKFQEMINSKEPDFNKIVIPGTKSTLKQESVGVKTGKKEKQKTNSDLSQSRIEASANMLYMADVMLTFTAETLCDRYIPPTIISFKDTSIDMGTKEYIDASKPLYKEIVEESPIIAEYIGSPIARLLLLKLQFGFMRGAKNKAAYKSNSTRFPGTSNNKNNENPDITIVEESNENTDTIRNS